MAISWSYLAASMAAMLLCCYLGSRDTSLRLCEWREFSAVVAETAKFLGSKTPYPLLQHIRTRAHVEVRRNLTGCQAVKVIHEQCYSGHFVFISSVISTVFLNLDRCMLSYVMGRDMPLKNETLRHKNLKQQY